MFHSTIKSQPHLSEQEGEKTLAQIWAGSHQVRVKLPGKTSALSFLVLKGFSLPVFTFTSAGWCIQTRMPVSSWPIPQDLNMVPCTPLRPLCTGQRDPPGHPFTQKAIRAVHNEDF